MGSTIIILIKTKEIYHNVIMMYKMDMMFDERIPIEEAYRLQIIAEEREKQRIDNTLVECDCGCKERYLYKDTELFQKTNYKHLNSRRDR